MHLQVVLFLAICILNCRGNDECPDKSEPTALRLRNYLLCGYDRNTRPVIDHKTAVPLVIQLILKYYNYDMHENSFTIDSWMALRWTDEHLKWNPFDYDSISRIILLDSDIWMPDISIYNRRTPSGDQAAVEAARCIVHHTGQISCVPSTSHTTICVSDLSKYPFDTHNCTVRLGSWVHPGEEIDIRVSKDIISTADLVPNGEWELIGTQAVKHPGKYKCCPNNTYPSLNLSFKIKRRAAAHSASVILPAIALIVLTLTSLWISPSNHERFSLCYVNVIGEFLYVQYISYMIPLNGDNVPLILLFARDSLLLSVFTVVFSLVLKNLVNSDNPPPEWLSKLVCVFAAFKPAQIIVFGGSSFKNLAEQGDDTSAIINNQANDDLQKKSEWILVSKILDRALFLIYIIVYTLMFIKFTP